MRTIRPAGAMSSVSVQLGMDPVCPPAVRARCLQSDGEGLPTSSLGVARLEELMSPPLERNSSTVLKPTNDYAVQDWVALVRVVWRDRLSFGLSNRGRVRRCAPFLSLISTPPGLFLACGLTSQESSVRASSPKLSPPSLRGK